MEKSNSGGGNWEAEHAAGVYDDFTEVSLFSILYLS